MKTKKPGDFGAQMSKTSPLPDARQATHGVIVSELTNQINEIRRLRREFEKSNSNEGTSATVRALNEKKKLEIKKQMALEKKMKSTLYHPNLEYILGEVVHSPYMTKPLDKYPKKTFTLVHELREYKRQGIKYKDLPTEKVPYNVEDIKKTFVNDIMHFKPNYSAVERTRAKSPPKDLEGDFTFGDRPTTAIQGTKRYKSDVLLAAEARGGPAKFKKQLAGMRKSRSSQDFDINSRANSSTSDRGRGSSDRQSSHAMNKSVSMPFFIKNPESKVEELKMIEIDGEYIEEEVLDAIIIIDPIDNPVDTDDNKYDDDRDFVSIPISSFGNASCLPGMVPDSGEINMYENDDFEMDVEEPVGMIKSIEASTAQEHTVIQLVEATTVIEPVQCLRTIDIVDNLLEYADAFEADDSFYNESVDFENASLHSDVQSVQSIASNTAADLINNAVIVSRNTISKLNRSPPNLPEVAIVDSDNDSISSMAKSIIESSVNMSKESIIKSRSSTPMRERDSRPSQRLYISELAKSMIDISITSASRNTVTRITSPLPMRQADDDDDDVSVVTQSTFISIKDEAEQFCSNVIGQVRQKQNKEII